MDRMNNDRRAFIRQASMSLVVPLIVGCRFDLSAQQDRETPIELIKKNAIQNSSYDWWGAKDAPASVASRIALADSADEGERIAITGTVYQRDGRTPAPATLIYLYHTDVHGIYGRGNEHRHGRYRGWMLTDKKGRYEFTSIMPASYPDSTQAKHIHMTLTTASMKEDWVDSILFEGDRFLTERARRIEKGGFDPVLKMTKRSDGVQTGVRDIILPA